MLAVQSMVLGLLKGASGIELLFAEYTNKPADHHCLDEFAEGQSVMHWKKAVSHSLFASYWILIFYGTAQRNLRAVTSVYLSTLTASVLSLWILALWRLTKWKQLSWMKEDLAYLAFKLHRKHNPN